MYRIYSANTGAEIGVTDSVLYIRVSPTSGCYIPAEKEQATGIALDSVAYDLFGHDEIQGADTVLVTEFDGGALAAEQQRLVDGLILSALEG